MKTSAITHFVIFALCLLVSFSCTDTPSKPSDVLDNPFDPKSPVFTDPVTAFDSLYNPGDTLFVSSIRVKLKKEKDVFGFAYKLDNEEWTEFDTSTIYLIEDLDEGEHHVQIKAKHIDKKTEEKEPKLLRFHVNAVKGPAMMFSARKKQVKVGDTFNLYIVAEEVQGLFGVKTSFFYDSTSFKINDFTFAQDIRNGSTDPGFFYMKYPNSIRAEMFFSLHDTLKNKIWSDTIFVLSCTAQKNGVSFLEFYSHIDSVQFRSSANIDIPIRQLVKGKVVVK